MTPANPLARPPSPRPIYAKQDDEVDEFTYLYASRDLNPEPVTGHACERAAKIERNGWKKQCRDAWYFYADKARFCSRIIDEHERLVVSCNCARAHRSEPPD